MSPQDIFLLLAILLIANKFIHFWKITTNSLLLLIVFAIGYIIYERRESTASPMSEISNPHYVHISSDKAIQDFLDTIQEYKGYNSVAFKSMITGFEQILQISLDIDIGIENSQYQYDVIRDIARRVLNHYHSFIYTLPLSPVTERKFHERKKTLKIILQSILDRTRSKIKDHFPIYLTNEMRDPHFDVWL